MVERRAWRVRVDAFLKVKATQSRFFNYVHDIIGLIKSCFALVMHSECQKGSVACMKSDEMGEALSSK
jgi:hypothetical protein